MTGKQKVGILSVICSSILSVAFWILVLRHIQATPVIWLIFWFSIIFGTITTSLIKYIYEVRG